MEATGGTPNPIEVNVGGQDFKLDQLATGKMSKSGHTVTVQTEKGSQTYKVSKEMFKQIESSVIGDKSYPVPFKAKHITLSVSADQLGTSGQVKAESHFSATKASIKGKKKSWMPGLRRTTLVAEVNLKATSAKPGKASSMSQLPPPPRLKSERQSHSAPALSGVSSPGPKRFDPAVSSAKLAINGLEGGKTGRSKVQEKVEIGQICNVLGEHKETIENNEDLKNSFVDNLKNCIDNNGELKKALNDEYPNDTVRELQQFCYDNGLKK